MTWLLRGRYPRDTSTPVDSNALFPASGSMVHGVFAEVVRSSGSISSLQQVRSTVQCQGAYMPLPLWAHPKLSSVASWLRWTIGFGLADYELHRDNPSISRSNVSTLERTLDPITALHRIAHRLPALCRTHSTWPRLGHAQSQSCLHEHSLHILCFIAWGCCCLSKN